MTTTKANAGIDTKFIQKQHKNYQKKQTHIVYSHFKHDLGNLICGCKCFTPINYGLKKNYNCKITFNFEKTIWETLILCTLF